MTSKLESSSMEDPINVTLKEEDAKALFALFLDIIEDKQAARYVCQTLRETLNLVTTIAQAKKNEAVGANVLCQIQLARDILELCDLDVDIVDGILRSQKKVSNIGDVAAIYYDVSTSIKDVEFEPLVLEKWKLNLFRLEPTAVLYNLVSRGEILVPAATKEHIERILHEAYQHGHDISSTPNRILLKQITVRPLPEVIEVLQNIQRLSALVRDPHDIGTLLSLDYTSARSIASTDVAQFLKKLTAAGITHSSASQIYDTAASVTVRNEQTWARLLKSRTDQLFPAVRASKTKEKSATEKPAITADGSQDVNFVSLFNEADAVDTCDCATVTSPAAYLVDLLENLRQVRIELGGTFFSKLLDRRPDLQYVELSCDNTNTTLPYIDLVNEILESYIDTKLLGNSPAEHPNTRADDTAESLAQSAQHVNSKIYEGVLSEAVYPMSIFPYNHAVDKIRGFSKVCGTSLAELRRNLGDKRRLLCHWQPSYKSFSDEKLESLAEKVLQRAIAAEELGLQEEDFVAITGEPFETWDFTRAIFPERHLLQRNQYYKSTSNGYSGVGKYWGYISDAAMLDMSGKDGLTNVRKQLMKRGSLSVEEITELLRTQYIGGRLILTSSDGCSTFSSDLEDLRLRTSVLISSDGHLTVEVCDDLQAFLRLQKKLGWTIPVLDAVLSCLARQTEQSVAGISASWIEELASIKRLSVLTGREVTTLLPLWSDIDTNGLKSLYAKLFLQNKRSPDLETFQLQDENGKYLGPKTEATLGRVSATLIAALRITHKDLSELLNASGLSELSQLSLANVSLLYRISTACRMFSVSFADYSKFVSFFAATDLWKSPTSTLDIWTHWCHLTDAGWTLADLWSVLSPQASVAVEIQMAAIKAAYAMRQGLKKIEEKYPAINSDYIVTREDVVTVSAMIFDAEIGDKAVAYVEGIQVHETSIDADQCPAKIPAPLSGKLLISPDGPSGKKITTLGSLTEAEKTQILALGEDQSIWRHRVGQLFAEANASVALLSKKLPDLNGSSFPELPANNATKKDILTRQKNLEQRRKRFTEQAYDFLRGQLLQQQVFELMNLDFPSLDAGILRTLITATVKKETSALSTLLEAISSIGTPDESAVAGGFFWPPTTDLYELTLSSDTKPAGLVLDQVELSWTKKEYNTWVSTPVRLTTGQPYKLEYGQTDLNALFWQTSSSIFSASSSDFYVSEDISQQVATIYQQLAKLEVLVKNVKLDSDDLQFFITDQVSSSFKADVQSLTLTTLTRLCNYGLLRDRIGGSDKKSLLSLLKWLQRTDRSGTLSEMLATTTTWPHEVVKDILDNKFPGAKQSDLIAHFQDEAVLLELCEVIQYLNRARLAGASTSQMFDWAIPGRHSQLFESASQMQQLLLGARGAQGNSETSPLVVANNRIRENQRSALIAYLLEHQKIKALKLKDSDALFEYFLIDVNMGAMLKTSRIQQAIATIQLYVQRCFLGLEKNDDVQAIDLQELKKKWGPLESYTLWEANRKIFLYPENWIDPTLRDNKTDQFKALESAILQNDLNKDTLLQAIRNYVLEVDTIAKLDAQAYLWEKRDGGLGNFHFFAKTRTEPFQFFYRKLEIESFAQERFRYWHPWTKLDLAVPPYAVNADGSNVQNPGSYLIPTIVKGRLYLFLPEITLKSAPVSQATSMANPQQPGQVQKSWEIKMAWSECRNGQWSPKATSTDILEIKPISMVKDGVTVSALPDLSSFKFRVRARAGAKATFASAAFGDGITEVLVIDVECWSTQQIDGINQNSPSHLGQFEMRDSQIYKSSVLPAPYKAEMKPLTAPTTFSKIVWDVKAGEQLPNYEIKELVNGQPTTFDPLLVHSSAIIQKPLKMAWTVSFDDTQYSRPIGLLVDVVTLANGPQSFFAYPPKSEIKLDTKSRKLEDWTELLPFDNQISSSLVKTLSTANKVEDIYKYLQTVSAQDYDTAAFGLYGELFYHELFTPYSVYNWELGYHIISLLMERLLATQQFELALKVARLVFDPTVEGSDSETCWLFPPFADTTHMPGETTEAMLNALTPDAGRAKKSVDVAVQEWRDNPFNPFAVARARPVTYKKRIVMKYIEILIAAGDELFKQNSLETIPLAIQRYVEAAHVFGPALYKKKPLGKRPNRTYNDIFKNVDAFSGVTVDMELEFPYSCLQRGYGVGESSAQPKTPSLLGILSSKYFAVPTNPQLIALRDLIDDRLTKIRNCQDINGNALKLPLFNPPIDPGMLVQAQNGAGGLSPSLLMSDLDSPMPNYRFVYLLSKALEMVNELKSMGDAFLLAKEKRDSEALSLLKSHQERIIQDMVLETKSLQKQDALKSIDGLEEIRKSHEARLSFYLQLIGEPVKIPGSNDDWVDIKQDIDEPTDDELRMSSNEKMEFNKAEEAAKINFATSIMDSSASYLMALPNLTTHLAPMGCGTAIKIDGENLAKFTMGMSTVLKLKAQLSSDQGARASRKAAMIRQLQDRRMQANLAGRDIKSVDKQIVNAKLRVQLTELDIKTQEKSIALAAETEQWYRSKYTNEQLYTWIENGTRSLFYEAYGITVELAKKAEKAFQFERGNKGARFLNQRGYWDSARDGLLSAQNLYLGLKKMELAYMEEKSHHFEITKTISLRQVNPKALMALRTEGQATFSLPELLFDLDFPGHYMRRIKTVSVSVPCITGPYTSLNCSLNLLEHKYRVSTTSPKGGYAERERDDRFRTDRIPISSIAVSDRQGDSGVFELNFNSERYLPFENAGVISQWQIQLPKEAQQFDYNTISDFIIHLRYTSCEGGSKLREGANELVKSFMAKTEEVAAKDGFFAFIDLKNDCSIQWQIASTKSRSSAESSMVLSGLQDRLPFWTRGKKMKADSLVLLAQLKDVGHVPDCTITLSLPANQEVSNLVKSPELRGDWTEYHLSEEQADVNIGDWELSIKGAVGDLNKFEKMVLLFQYHTA